MPCKVIFSSVMWSVHYFKFILFLQFDALNDEIDVLTNRIRQTEKLLSTASLHEEERWNSIKSIFLEFCLRDTIFKMSYKFFFSLQKWNRKGHHLAKRWDRRSPTTAAWNEIEQTIPHFCHGIFRRCCFRSIFWILAISVVWWESSGCDSADVRFRVFVNVAIPKETITNQTLYFW